jgi:hypothetical protein
LIVWVERVTSLSQEANRGIAFGDRQVQRSFEDTRLKQRGFELLLGA